jgi:hypothetical protein
MFWEATSVGGMDAGKSFIRLSGVHPMTDEIPNAPPT